MPKLILKPTNQVIEVSSKKSIFEQLKENNIYLNSSCGGFGTCGDCVVKISKGEEHCSPPTYQEIKLLGNVFHLTHERLSCQLKINAEVEIDISAQLNSLKPKRPKPVSSLKTKRRKASATESSPKPAVSSKEEITNEKPTSPEKQSGFNRPKRKKFR